MIFFFVNNGSSLASKIQSTGTDLKKYLPDASVKSLFFTPTSEQEICQIVNTFKGCKAPGIDEFSPKVVKSVIDLISVPLSCIFNLSMCQGVFPEKLKLAKVSPVFKKRVINLIWIITDQYQFYQCFQRFWSGLCISESIHFLRKIISFMGVKLDFVKAFP